MHPDFGTLEKIPHFLMKEREMLYVPQKQHSHVGGGVWSWHAERDLLSFFLSCCEPVALLLRVYNFDVQQASKKAWYLHTDQDRPECVSELQQSTCWTLVTTCK